MNQGHQRLGPALPILASLLLTLVIGGCGGAAPNKKAGPYNSPEYKKSASDNRKVAVDAPPSDDAGDERPPDDVRAYEKDERSAEEESVAEKRMTMEAKRDERLSVDREADPAPPRPADAPMAVDPMPTVQMDAPGVASESARRRRDAGEFEGDVWEEETPFDEVQELVKDIEDVLEGARSDGYAQDTGGSSLTCEDVCDLSDAICSSSSKICVLSSKHPTETYFSQKCGWSKTQCRDAGKQCRVCAR